MLSNFSNVIPSYVDARPDYPSAFYSKLLEFVPVRTNDEPLYAWDCATGANATVARSLRTAFTSRFSHLPIFIHATDIDNDNLVAGQQAWGANFNNQIQIVFSHAAAEVGPPQLQPHQKLALTCVGNAVHWFEQDQFFQTVHNLSHPNGIVAVWTHRLEPRVPGNDDLIGAFQFIGNRLRVWEAPCSKQFVTGGYQNLAFPFDDEILLPEYMITKSMNLSRLRNYYISVYLKEITEEKRKQALRIIDNSIERKIAPLWGDPRQERMLEWTMDLRAARVGSYNGPR